MSDPPGSDRGEARLIVISNRIVKAMGYDWFDQLENAPGFGGRSVPPGGTEFGTPSRG